MSVNRSSIGSDHDSYVNSKINASVYSKKKKKSEPVDKVLKIKRSASKRNRLIHKVNIGRRVS